MDKQEFNKKHKVGSNLIIIDDSEKEHAITVVGKAWEMVGGGRLETFFTGKLISGTEMDLTINRLKD